jgi:hypothetical protein
MGDSCCSLGSIGSVAKAIEDELGVFVYSIATGEGEYKDIWSSFYGECVAARGGRDGGGREGGRWRGTPWRGVCQ